MGSVIYDSERSDRATATPYLEKRIEINQTYSSVDFNAWLLERLRVQPGEHVLDVGCGTGAQAIPFSRLVGAAGTVSALDISAESIALLRSRIPAGARVEAVAADMAALPATIQNEFSVKRFSLAHSSYALYYSPKRLDVLDTMRMSLLPRGRCAVFTPDRPHGLVELAARFSTIPPEVNESLRFGPDVLRPYFDKNFARVEVHSFNNVVTVPSADILVEFYRQTTYYVAAAEADIRRTVEADVRRSGKYQYEKNGYLIIGFANE